MVKYVVGWARRPVAVAALALLMPAGLKAQQVRQDPATGHYYVTVYDDARQPVEILVESAGLVEFLVAPMIRSTTVGFHYTYDIKVAQSSRQALGTFQLDCPASDTAIQNLSATAIDEGDELWTDLVEWADLPSCFVELGAIPLPAGERLRAEFDSVLLPAIGEARGLGAVRGISWPTSDPIPENDAAREFVRSVQGFTGGWKAVPTIVPARDPALLDDPTAWMGILRADLDRACTDLAWITNSGVCRSLQAKLDAAARALERGQPGAARGPLASFLQELDAEHGAGPGKHVSDNAYWLLKINVEYLIERL